jgi:hypothetical protein
MSFFIIILIYVVLGFGIFAWVIDDYKFYLERRELNIPPYSIIEFTHNDLYDLAERMGGHNIKKNAVIKPWLIIIAMSILVIPCLIINTIHCLILDK